MVLPFRFTNRRGFSFELRTARSKSEVFLDRLAVDFLNHVAPAETRVGRVARRDLRWSPPRLAYSAKVRDRGPSRHRGSRPTRPRAHCWRSFAALGLHGCFRGRQLTQFHRDFPLGSIAEHLQVDSGIRRHHGNRHAQVVGVRDGLAVDVQDDVAFLEAALRSRAVRADVGRPARRELPFRQTPWRGRA